MKKILLISIMSIICITLCSCNLQQTHQQKQGVLTDEEVDEFAKNNNIKLLSISESKENYSIITYERVNEYGIMKLFRDPSSDEIAYIQENVKTNDDPKKVAYVQLSDNNEKYICFFILDEDLMQRANDITVEFKDKEQPYKIAITTNKQRAIVIPYVNEDNLREIEKIIIRDENHNEIYVK